MQEPSSLVDNDNATVATATELEAVAATASGNLPISCTETEAEALRAAHEAEARHDCCPPVPSYPLHSGPH